MSSIAVVLGLTVSNVPVGGWTYNVYIHLFIIIDTDNVLL